MSPASPGDARLRWASPRDGGLGATCLFLEDAQSEPSGCGPCCPDAAAYCRGKGAPGSEAPLLLLRAPRAELRRACRQGDPCCGRSRWVASVTPHPARRDASVLRYNIRSSEALGLGVSMAFLAVCLPFFFNFSFFFPWPGPQ